MGLPPSGGFAAKWLLIRASVEAGQWIWAAYVIGGLLAAGYLYRVLAPALANERGDAQIQSESSEAARRSRSRSP